MQTRGKIEILRNRNFVIFLYVGSLEGVAGGSYLAGEIEIVPHCTEAQGRD
jgi:hypothetical protein